MTDTFRKFGVPQVAAVATRDNIIYEGMRGLERETGQALSDINDKVLQIQGQIPAVPVIDLYAKFAVGSATLVAGTTRVYTAKLTYTSHIFPAHRGPAILGTLGHLYAPPSARNVGAGYFDIVSSDATDDSEVEWWLANE